MKPVTVPSAETLKQAQLAFSEHLRERGGKRSHWPRRLQQMAVSAVTSGHGAAAVGRALGVSGKSVGNWCRRSRAPSAPKSVSKPPTELKIIQRREPPPSVPGTAAVPAVMVRVLFRGGACLECPVSALSVELVAALNGGGS